ncbi:MAPEG family protein [Thalassotalea ganghwensis]
MTLLIGCLVIAMLFPLLSKAPLAIAQQRMGRYDNNYPREQQAKLTGFGARALAGHQNSFEALILFAPAILLAITTNNTHQYVVQLAITYIICRFAYHVFYLTNWGLLRSLVWIIAIVCNFLIAWECLINASQ